MLFLLLNSFITPLVVIAGWTVIRERVGQYLAAFLIMSGLLNGVFAALDGMLFYVFFEATLVPMFVIIGVWGGANRVYAYCTHPVFSGPAIERIAASQLDEVVITNTIPLNKAAQACKKIRQLSVAFLFAETIRRISDGESVTSLFAEQNNNF